MMIAVMRVEKHNYGTILYMDTRDVFMNQSLLLTTYYCTRTGLLLSAKVLKFQSFGSRTTTTTITAFPVLFSLCFVHSVTDF